MKKLSLVLILLSVLLSCRDKNGDGNDNLVTATGTIYKQGITTYQYGSHVLSDTVNNVFYALRSNTIDLDQYLNQQVEVKGTLVYGYPVDDGPDYLEVKSVK